MSILSYFPQGGSGGDVLCFKSVIVNPSDWDDSVYDTNYPYEAVLTLNGVTADHFPVVAFEDDDDANYVFLNIAQTGTDSITIYAKKAPTSLIIIPSITCYESTVSSWIGTLEETSWDVISTISQMGIASDYWSIGDTKSVTLNGTVGTLNLNTTLAVYIIGINHEGKNGITFQGFKDLNNISVALVDDNYDGTSSDGSLKFNINHWGSSSSPYNGDYGGWKGCDLRYDILGSTDVAPSGYGSVVTTNRIGYDASLTTATNPVNNTLMSCLPSDLRVVMKPITIYTDNSSSGAHVSESSITTSIDYLPLLAEKEIRGNLAQPNANQYEKNYQTRYKYYVDGGSRINYKYSDSSTAVNYWLRSPYSVGHTSFCKIYTSGDPLGSSTRTSIGISPFFLV